MRLRRQAKARASQDNPRPSGKGKWVSFAQDCQFIVCIGSKLNYDIASHRRHLYFFVNQSKKANFRQSSGNQIFIT